MKRKEKKHRKLHLLIETIDISNCKKKHGHFTSSVVYEIEQAKFDLIH